MSNFLLVGVGGQGTLLAADVVALVGMAQGLDVKKSEVHGMAQRGGSVTSHVRWAEKVNSPLIAPGEVDYFVAFERLEALRFSHLLSPTGHLLENDYRIVPVSVSSGKAVYPDESAEEAALAGQVAHRHLVPAMALARELGNPRINNIILLGALSAIMDVDRQVWCDVICGRVPERFRDLNLAGFEAGRQWVLDQ